MTLKLKTVGNYVHDGVPVSATEDDNKTMRTWEPTTPPTEGYEKPTELLSHHQVLYRLGGYNPDAGTKIVGHRGYCLTGLGWFLCVLL